MNEKNGYESDISEGWSLIDINLNEESVNTSEAHLSLENENILQSDPSKSIFTETNGFKSLEPSKNKFNNEMESDNKNLSDFSSGEGPSIQEFSTIESLDKEKDTLMSETPNDSCDAESIEILDVDGNYRDSDIDSLDVTVIDKQDLDSSDQSSDKESLCEESQEYNTHSLNGTKRKKQKLSGGFESPTNTLVSEIAPSDGKYSCTTSNEDMKTEGCKLNKHHVYRHYRNNLANTVLSLSMSVIFAGVACIAIGHFLGVHDAEETAGELYDTLKKLQMENIALQSRLSQLNRALFTREVASKLESSPNKVPCDDTTSNFESEKSESDHMSQSSIHPNLNSVEWLLKVHKLVQKGCINNEMVDITKITNYIQDLLTFLSIGKKEDNRIQDLEEANAKISKLLQKMMAKLSSSQDNLENLYSRFLKLKERFNRKVKKFFPDLMDEYVCHRQEDDDLKLKMKTSLPVIEKDLYSIQWNPIGKTTQPIIMNKELKKNPNTTVSLYIFPQPEEYYFREKNSFSKEKNTTLSIADEKVTDFSKVNEKDIPINEELMSQDKENAKNKGKQSEETDEKKGEKKDGKQRRKTKKRSEKKSKNGKTKKGLNEKDLKENVHKLKNERVKRVEKTYKRRLENGDTKDSNKKTRGKFDEEKGKTKKASKIRRRVLREGAKHESKIGIRKKKTVKSPKQFWPKKGKQEAWLEPNGNSQFYPKEDFLTESGVLDGKFLNFTGDWFFRLSEGRDEFRRQKVLGDWQFERAKARTEWRNGDKLNTNWLFLRALAREDGRMDKLSNSRK